MGGKRSSTASLPRIYFEYILIYGDHLLFSGADIVSLELTLSEHKIFVLLIYGSAEFICGIVHNCIWISEEAPPGALKIYFIRSRIEVFRKMLLTCKDTGARAMAVRANQFRKIHSASVHTLILPSDLSEAREYLSAGLIDANSVVSNLAFTLCDASLRSLALIASGLHVMWLATVSGKLKTDYRYCNRLGWKIFVAPLLTKQNKANLNKVDLNTCAENLHYAHERNEEILKSIYSARRFNNATEQLKKLFDFYPKITTADNGKPVKKATQGRKA